MPTLFRSNDNSLDTPQEAQDSQDVPESNHKTSSWILLFSLAASATTIALILSDLRYPANNSVNEPTSDYITKAAQVSMVFLSACCILWASRELFANCRSRYESRLSNTDNMANADAEIALSNNSPRL